MNRKKRREAGAFAIETAISLTFFMLAILALMMGSMLIRAQASMQYALNQTAKEISGYFYLLDKFGIASALSENTTDSADADLQELNSSITHIISFAGDFKDDAQVVNSELKEAADNAISGNLTKEEIEELKNITADEKDKIEQAVNTVKDDLDKLKNKDKKVMFRAVLQVFSRACINTAFSKYVTPLVCDALMPKYLTNGDLEAYYKNIGIDPPRITLQGSHMLGDGRSISLVCEYQVDASKLTLGFYKKKLTFRHVASTSAWIRKNDSGSLQDLETIGWYFDKGYQLEREKELELLNKQKEEEKEKQASEASSLAEALSTTTTTTTTKDDTTTTTTTTGPDDEDKATTTTTTTTAISAKDQAKIDKFIKDYPEGKELYEKYGMAVIDAVNGCQYPKKAIQVMMAAKNGNPEYGEEAITALKKAKDKAATALANIPSKDCASLIAKYGGDAASLFSKKNGAEVLAFVKTLNPDDDTQRWAILAINGAADSSTVMEAIKNLPTKDCAHMLYNYPSAANLIIDHGQEALTVIRKGEDAHNAQGVIDLLNSKGKDPSRYKDIMAALDKVTPSPRCTSLMKSYPDETILIALDENYGDEAINAVASLNADQKNAMTALINATNPIDRTEYLRDIKQLGSWKYQPTFSVFEEHRTVFKNKKYYDQDTGSVQWPDDDGFVSSTKTEVTLSPGTLMDRYGKDTGNFTSPYSREDPITYTQRSLRPGTEYEPYVIYEIVEPIQVTEGEIAPWFDETGGGRQYKFTEKLETLLKEGKIKKISITEYGQHTEWLEGDQALNKKKN
jgi:hypothetical protein